MWDLKIFFWNTHVLNTIFTTPHMCTTLDLMCTNLFTSLYSFPLHTTCTLPPSFSSSSLRRLTSYSLNIVSSNIYMPPSLTARESCADHHIGCSSSNSTFSCSCHRRRSPNLQDNPSLLIHLLSLSLGENSSSLFLFPCVRWNVWRNNRANRDSFQLSNW